MSKLIVSLLFLLMPYLLYSEILVITHAYNQPKFIELQYKSLSKFLLNEFRYVVFNDANRADLCDEINAICKKLDIECFVVPQYIHEKPYLDREVGLSKHFPSVRNANCVQYSLDILGYKHNDIVMIIDSDLFLIKSFNAEQVLKDFDLAAFNKPCSYLCNHQNKKDIIEYIWIGLVVMNMKTLPNKNSLNFNCGYTYDKKHLLDAGGFTYYYLKNNLNCRIKWFNRIGFFLVNIKRIN